MHHTLARLAGLAGATVLAATSTVTLTVAPAQASIMDPIGVEEFLIHSVDKGYDAPIKVTCRLKGDDNGGPLATRRIAEDAGSHQSPYGCKDVRWLYVAEDTDVSCEEYALINRDEYEFRATGWREVTWENGVTCSVSLD